MGGGRVKTDGALIRVGVILVFGGSSAHQPYQTPTLCSAHACMWGPSFGVGGRSGLPARRTQPLAS